MVLNHRWTSVPTVVLKISGCRRVQATQDAQAGMDGPRAAGAGTCGCPSQALASVWQPVLARLQRGLARGAAVAGAMPEVGQAAWRWGQAACVTQAPGPERAAWPGWGLLLHAGVWAAVCAAEGRFVQRRP
jgi:hypothetical protein